MNNRHRQIEKAEQMRYLSERQALRSCADFLININWDALDEAVRRLSKAFGEMAEEIYEAMMALARQL